MNPDQTQFSMADLTQAAGTYPRNIRKYIKLGLMDRPVGRTKAAVYGPTHLAQLLKIRELTGRGMTLTEIRSTRAETASPQTDPVPKSVESAPARLRTEPLGRGAAVFLYDNRLPLTQEDEDEVISLLSKLYAKEAQRRVVVRQGVGAVASQGDLPASDLSADGPLRSFQAEAELPATGP